MVLFILERPIHGTLRWSAPAACAHRTIARTCSRPLVELARRRPRRSSGASTTRCGARTAHNPVRMLWMLPRARARASRAGSHVAAALRPGAGRTRCRARGALHVVRASRCPDLKGQSIAYFSAEFALHQSLPIYAGGLGVLAGDHCKEASDLGVPLIGVGFMYPQGYFHQHITADGWQEEGYEKLNWADAPIEQATDANGEPCITAVPLGDRTVLVAVWRVRLGRVTLVPARHRPRRERALGPVPLGAPLRRRPRDARPAGDHPRHRRRPRAAPAWLSTPTVWHLNEGHAGFVVLQRIREFVDQGLSFDAALDEVRRTTVFTTHTPVPAGHDAFNFQLVEKHLAGAWGSLGTYRPQFLALGEYDNGNGPQFNMTALALRASASVERRQPAPRRGHARDVGADLAGHPGRRCTRQGAHQRCARADLGVERDGAALLAASRRGLDRTARRPGLWDRILDVPDAELWAVRSSLRHYLFSFIRQRARSLWTNERVSAARVLAAGTLLDSDALDHRLRAAVHRLQASRPGLPRPRAAGSHPEQPQGAPCSSCSRANHTPPTTPASTACRASIATRSSPRSPDAWRSSRTTTCTWRTSSCRAATSG